MGGKRKKIFLLFSKFYFMINFTMKRKFWAEMTNSQKFLYWDPFFSHSILKLVYFQKFFGCLLKPCPGRDKILHYIYIYLCCWIFVSTVYCIDCITRKIYPSLSLSLSLSLSHIWIYLGKAKKYQCSILTFDKYFCRLTEFKYPQRLTCYWVEFFQEINGNTFN